MAEPPTRTRARSGAHTVTWAAITVLLLAAIVATLWVPFYNDTKPTLGGFPFFYWYQLLWIPIVAVLSLIAYLLTRSVSGTAARERAPAAGPGDAGGGPSASGTEGG